MTGSTPAAGNTNDVETTVSLKQFKRFLENSTLFKTADTKLYIPVVTLSTQDNAKLLEQLKLGFKRMTNQSEN